MTRAIRPKALWWWIGGTVVLVATTLTLVLLPIAPSARSSPLGIPPPPDPSDMQFGAVGASVSVIEYADLECSSCAVYAPIMKQLRIEYGDRVRFVFRFFVLEQHRYGIMSAQAAVAAQVQGRFWDMTDLLYQHQEEWSVAAYLPQFLTIYAQSLGLDIPAFFRDMQAADTVRLIGRQKAEALKIGLEGVPTFFINGLHVVPHNYREFSALIDEALQREG